MSLHAKLWPGPPSGTPLVILHGLLGSSRNWASVARDLSSEREVWVLDARNHGASPHFPTHGYGDQEADTALWLRSQFDQPVHLLGHSMGGKTAMRVACRHPQLIRSLTVVDIVPKDYTSGRHEPALDALLGIDLHQLANREDADVRLSGSIPDWALRRFLLTNLDNSTGSWRWLANLAVLRKHLPELERNSVESTDSFSGRCLFVLGGRSDYFVGGDHEAISRHFPAARIEFIPDSGHNPHFETREAFVELLKPFLVSDVSPPLL
jgi:pimeloyl-ACP methyl ester carboxylesterase